MAPAVPTFLRQCLALKEEARRGWRFKAGVPHPESVADHTFGVALLALVYGELLQVDTCRIIKMALVHDLAEASLGDATPEEYAGKVARRRAEARAFDKLVRPLPLPVRRALLASWMELLEAESREAKLVWQMDRLEMGLQALRYGERGFAEAALREFVLAARAGVREPLLRELLTRRSSRN